MPTAPTGSRPEAWPGRSDAWGGPGLLARFQHDPIILAVGHSPSHCARIHGQLPIALPRQWTVLRAHLGWSEADQGLLHIGPVSVAVPQPLVS